jgi:hypothetical protein
MLTIVGFVLASQFIKPAPPTRFVIATGRTDGAYYQIAKNPCFSRAGGLTAPYHRSYCKHWRTRRRG